MFYKALHHLYPFVAATIFAMPKSTGAAAKSTSQIHRAKNRSGGSSFIRLPPANGMNHQDEYKRPNNALKSGRAINEFEHFDNSTIYDKLHFGFAPWRYQGVENRKPRLRLTERGFRFVRLPFYPAGGCGQTMCIGKSFCRGKSRRAWR